MNLKRLHQLERAALPAINRVRKAFGAPKLARLNLRCENVVGNCPVAMALKPARVNSVYANVLALESWEEEEDKTMIADFRKIARVWKVSPRRKRYDSFCCHRHFDEKALTISLPEKVKAFVHAFIEYKSEDI